MTKARVNAFGKKCDCTLCKKDKCIADRTHYVIKANLFVCWVCADRYEKEGYEIGEIVF